MVDKLSPFVGRDFYFFASHFKFIVLCIPKHTDIATTRPKKKTFCHGFLKFLRFFINFCFTLINFTGSAWDKYLMCLKLMNITKYRWWYFFSPAIISTLHAKQNYINQGSFCHVKVIANPFSSKCNAPNHFSQSCIL